MNVPQRRVDGVRFAGSGGKVDGAGEAGVRGAWSELPFSRCRRAAHVRDVRSRKTMVVGGVALAAFALRAVHPL